MATILGAAPYGPGARCSAPGARSPAEFGAPPIHPDPAGLRNRSWTTRRTGGAAAAGGRGTRWSWSVAVAVAVAVADGCGSPGPN
ncbi:hypothetical protein GCM10009759_08600 [Kitasatospora saccharophila]|uniref:Uncharacterized protein n=1 Tax=Kitasatospora saccharophila TaxID=407973 RepID=A0ABP5HUS4_9ACTN